MPRQGQLRKVSIPNQAPRRPFAYMALFVLCLFIASSLNLSAAPDSGRISGRILDPQGVPVAGAHVKLSNSAGTVARESTSDAQGNFILDAVSPGEYQLTAESDAFVSVILDISLAAGQQKETSLQFQQL